MTLPATGLIKFSAINVELGRAANAPLSLSDAACRALAGIPSGLIKLSDFHGKSSIPPGFNLHDMYQFLFVTSGKEAFLLPDRSLLDYSDSSTNGIIGFIKLLKLCNALLPGTPPAEITGGDISLGTPVPIAGINWANTTINFGRSDSSTWGGVGGIFYYTRKTFVQELTEAKWLSMDDNVAYINILGDFGIPSGSIAGHNVSLINEDQTREYILTAATGDMLMVGQSIIRVPAGALATD